MLLVAKPINTCEIIFLVFVENDFAKILSPHQVGYVQGGINPGKQEGKPDSVQYPLEGYKCLGDVSEFTVSKILPDFLFFSHLKGVLN